MATLHIENTVRNFDDWKAAFDKYEQFRVQHGVQAYRVVRNVSRPNDLMVDLDFESTEQATTFIGHLNQIWATPQSQEQMIQHSTPEIYELVSDGAGSAIREHLATSMTTPISAGRSAGPSCARRRDSSGLDRPLAGQVMVTRWLVPPNDWK